MRLLIGLVVGPLVVSVLPGARGAPQSASEPVVFSARIRLDGIERAYGRYWRNRLDLGLEDQSPVEITISQWSTATERTQAFAALRERGHGALRELLESWPRLGRATLAHGHEYSKLMFADRRLAADGGELITLILESLPARRGIVDLDAPDYVFEVIQLQVNSQGRGQGRVSFLTSVEADGLSDEMLFRTWRSTYATLLDVRRKR